LRICTNHNHNTESRELFVGCFFRTNGICISVVVDVAVLLDRYLKKRKKVYDVYVIFETKNYVLSLEVKY
jgi:hypothetical protein